MLFTPTDHIIVTTTLEDRFLEGVVLEGDCWLWRGNPHGCKVTLISGVTTISPMRISWALAKRRVLAGDEPVHVTCTHKAPSSGYRDACCNPDHLEAHVPEDLMDEAYGMLDHAFGSWRI